MLCIWLLSGAYRWIFKVRDDRTTAILKLAYPRTFSAANVASDWHGKENADNWLREQAIKETIATLVSQEGGLCWVIMEIDLGTKVTEEEPEIAFIDRCGATVDLGEQCEGVGNMFYDRFMVIDMKIPSSSFKKKEAKRARIYDEDQAW